jgi:transposase
MVGKRSAQGYLFSAEQRLRHKIGEESFYALLADHRHELFHDDDFAMLYCADNGRSSVPPSLLAVALLLQTFDKTSDQEATDRAKFDQRWQFALGIADDEVPFAKSTLCLFRNQLIIHKDAKFIFQKGIEFLRTHGFMKKHGAHIVLDTTPIFGKGAVADTFNMLAEGLRQVLKVLATLESTPIEQFAGANDFRRYVAPSYKGTWTLDWDNEQQRQVVLESLVADCKRVLALASRALALYAKETAEATQILQASELLSKLLAQDVRENPAGTPEIIQGVARDRIIAVHDPEMRHGHKSKTQRFDGYKGSLAVESETTVITDVDVLPANVHDHQNATQLIDNSAATLQAPIEGVIGDGAYGNVEARVDAQTKGHTLVAPVGRPAQTGRFTKDDFTINLVTSTVRCPAGQTTTTWSPAKVRTQRGTVFVNKAFRFSREQCAGCALRTKCLKPSTPFRTVSVHEHEALLQQAKAFQRTEEFRIHYRKRVVVEHRIARVVRLGIRTARYVGSNKVLFQLAMAATVANLTIWASHATHTPFLNFALSLFCSMLVFTVSRMRYELLGFLRQTITVSNNYNPAKTGVLD